MKRSIPFFLLITALLWTAICHPGQGFASEVREPVLLKDPLLAGYLSITAPGLGQAYAGNKGRGALFFLGVAGTFVTAAALSHPAQLRLSDYDRAEYGGNADGAISVAEARNWETKKYRDRAFDRLSPGRKTGVILGATTGLGLYVWNILDARSLARAHNREALERKVSLGLQLDPSSPQLALQVRF